MTTAADLLVGEKLTGQVTHIKYERAGSLIGVLQSGPIFITFKGFMPGVEMGCKVTIEGKRVIDKKYGEQLDVESYSYPEQSDATLVQRQLAESVVFVKKELGLKKIGDNIIRTYGAAAKTIILKNPYQIARDVPRIGFKTADEMVAQKLGIKDDDPRRVDECIVHCLRITNDTKGHVYLPYSKLIEMVAEFTGIEDDRIEAGLERLAKEDPERYDPKPRIVIERNKGKKIVYSHYLYGIETGIAKHLKRIAESKILAVTINEEELKQGIPAARDIGKPPLVLTDEQREAVIAALTNPLTIITGGPGVGKTTIIAAITRIMQKNYRGVALCAHYGRAAKRMEEAIFEKIGVIHEASTLHRLLAYNPSTNGFRYNNKTPLHDDMIICDETSTIDIILGHGLLDAIYKGSKLVFVGDIDQLPAIGPGHFFRDIIDSGLAKVVRLTKIFRQKEQSLIVQGSRKILRQEIPDFGKSKDDDLFMFSYKNIERAGQIIAELLTEKIPKNFGIETKDIQVIVPQVKGPMGTLVLNKILQHAIHKKNTWEENQFFVGDRVIQVRNNYELPEGPIYNGDVGYVVEIGKREIVVDFGGQKYPIPDEFMKDIHLAYAVTAHKSQGSEYAAVIVLAGGTTRPGFYNRNMFYTALTRGKQLTAVVTSNNREIIKDILATGQRKRWTLLAERIRREVSGEEPVTADTKKEDEEELFDDEFFENS